MPELIQIQGPVRVQWCVYGASSFRNLGFTNRDGRPQVRREHLVQPVGSDEHGDEPAHFVHTGQQVAIEFILETWDKAELQDLLAHAKPGDVDGAGEGRSGIIGSTWWDYDENNGIPQYATSAVFTIRFLPLMAGKDMWTFMVCKFMGEGHREIGMGNDGTQLAMSIAVYREQLAALPAASDFFYLRENS